jgi:hypothetical protein
LPFLNKKTFSFIEFIKLRFEDLPPFIIILVLGFGFSFGSFGLVGSIYSSLLTSNLSISLSTSNLSQAL